MFLVYNVFALHSKSNSQAVSSNMWTIKLLFGGKRKKILFFLAIAAVIAMSIHFFHWK